MVTSTVFMLQMAVRLLNVDISGDIFISFFLTEISVLFLFDTLMSPFCFHTHKFNTVQHHPHLQNPTLTL